MAVVGVVLSASDGIVVAADTAPGMLGAANDTIHALNTHTACYSWDAPSALALQAFVAATNPMPPQPLQIVSALLQYLTTNPPAQIIGFALAGVESGSPGGNVVVEITRNPGGGAPTRNVFPGNLFLGAHSVGRYLTDRMYGSMKMPLPLAQEHAVFTIGETRLAVPTVRPHTAMARIDRATGLAWASDVEIAGLTERAFARSRKLWRTGIDLF